MSRSSGAGMVMAADERGRSGKSATSGGSGRPVTTDEPGSLAGADGEVSADPETLRRAREIAARLALRRPKRDLLERRGAGTLASVPYRGGSDDVDLDQTVERLAEKPMPE